MLKLIEYFKSGGTTEGLTEKYAIKVKTHPGYPNLKMFNYDQLDSPMGDPLVQECRGIILDFANNYEVVSFPYTKFFNHGEGHAAKIDWNTAYCFEKLDGSLMTLYHYDGKWNVASSGTPAADSEVNGTGKTLAELFWETFRHLGYFLPTNTDCCYMFELMTPYNRIVVQHKKNRLVLHGVRNTKTLKELFPFEFAHINGWECVKYFQLRTLDQVLKSCNDIDPIAMEGYVVCDANFNRNKIKSPQYVALHHTIGKTSPKEIVKIVQTNEHSEFLNYFPEFKELYDDIKFHYDALISHTETAYEKIKGIEDQKQFALRAVENPLSGLMFQLRKGAIKSIAEGLARMPEDKVFDHIKRIRVNTVKN